MADAQYELIIYDRERQNEAAFRRAATSARRMT